MFQFLFIYALCFIIFEPKKNSINFQIWNIDEINDINDDEWERMSATLFLMFSKISQSQNVENYFKKHRFEMIHESNGKLRAF